MNFKGKHVSLGAVVSLENIAVSVHLLSEGLHRLIYNNKKIPSFKEDRMVNPSARILPPAVHESSYLFDEFVTKDSVTITIKIKELKSSIKIGIDEVSLEYGESFPCYTNKEFMTLVTTRLSKAVKDMLLPIFKVVLVNGNELILNFKSVTEYSRLKKDLKRFGIHIDDLSTPQSVQLAVD